MDNTIVLTAFQEDIVLRGTLDGEVAKQRSRRILQAAVGVAVGRETRRKLQSVVSRRIVRSNEADRLRISFVWRSRSFAKDVVPVMSVLVGSNSLETLIRHIVLAVIDVESVLHHLCFGTQQACQYGKHQ